MLRLATEVGDAKGPIVEGTFTSIPAVIGTMKWGWLPLAPLVTQRFDSADRIEHVKVPVLSFVLVLETLQEASSHLR